TRARGVAVFWSRSRGALWEKGETSGHRLVVRELRVDCDGDALLLIVEPTGPACHTGATSCWYRRADGDALETDDGPGGAPAAIVERVHRVLETRKAEGDGGKSYTAA